jgi:hypothetical protein
MSAPSSDNAPWGFIEWAITGLSTLLASGCALAWRLMHRLEALEAAQEYQRVETDAIRLANDAIALRFDERFAQLQDEHYRLREILGVLPTRGDLRDLEDRLAERLNSVVARLDRAIDA